MGLTWEGVRERIEQHRRKYPGSKIRCPSVEEWKRMVAEKGEEGVNHWYQELIGEIVNEERVLTPRVIVIRKKRSKQEPPAPGRPT